MSKDEVLGQVINRRARAEEKAWHDRDHDDKKVTKSRRALQLGRRIHQVERIDNELAPEPAHFPNPMSDLVSCLLNENGSSYALRLNGAGNICPFATSSMFSESSGALLD